MTNLDPLNGQHADWISMELEPVAEEYNIMPLF